MLGSLTALGERGRGRRFGWTYAWFVAGSLVGAALLACVLLAVHVVATMAPGVAAALAVVAVAYCAVGLARRRAPHSLARQVDHRWLDRYRGWFVGFGFGLQLGSGVTVRVASYSLHLLVACALAGATSQALVAAAIVYGAVRALTASPGGLVRCGRDLATMALRLARSERAAVTTARLLDGGVAAGLAVTIAGAV